MNSRQIQHAWARYLILCHIYIDTVCQVELAATFLEVELEKAPTSHDPRSPAPILQSYSWSCTALGGSYTFTQPWVVLTHLHSYGWFLLIYQVRGGYATFSWFLHSWVSLTQPLWILYRLEIFLQSWNFAPTQHLKKCNFYTAMSYYYTWVWQL